MHLAQARLKQTACTVLRSPVCVIQLVCWFECASIDAPELQPPLQLGTLFALYLGQSQSNHQALSGKSIQKSPAVLIHLAWPDRSKTACTVLRNSICATQLMCQNRSHHFSWEHCLPHILVNHSTITKL
jgi:hypothetical protein